MAYRYYFSAEQSIERVFILYGNTTDCYYSGNHDSYMLFERFLEHHLGAQGFENVVFYNGIDELVCYESEHANKLISLIDEPNQANASDDERNNEDMDEEDCLDLAGLGNFVTPDNETGPALTANIFRKKIHNTQVAEKLDAVMQNKSVRSCVVFTHCWRMLDMQNNSGHKEELAGYISSWYSLNVRNQNICILLFAEPRLESLAGFLRNKSAWAFLYERMFQNDKPTDAVIRIGTPQVDEVYSLLDKELLGESEMITPAVLKASMTLIHKNNKRLLALKRYTETFKNTDGFIPRNQRKEMIRKLLEEYGDARGENALEKIKNTEGWQEVYKTISRIIEEGKDYPQAQNDPKEICDTLQETSLRMTYPDVERGNGVNMVIMLKGNPGTGKTTAAKWIGEALRQHGLLPVGQVVKVTKDDLQAGYVGQTAIKTKEKINEAIGNVLFVDEAYSLFDKENDGHGSFGMEVIDTLVEAMSDLRGKLAFIFAGYPKDMDHFLTANAGLRRRFGYNIVTIEDFSPAMLEKIALEDIDKDSNEGLSPDPIAEKRKKNYVIAPELMCIEHDLNYLRSDVFFDPKQAMEKAREDRQRERELCPLSIYFDNWYADRDRKYFGNAAAALELADNIRRNAFRRGEQHEEAYVIRDKDFPEGTDHLFICRKPSVSEIERQMEDVVGMTQVKETLKRILDYLQLVLLQNEKATVNGRNKISVEPGHYLFVGNPGTGKTMISEKLALALSGLGIIQRYQPVRKTGLELINMLTGHSGIDKLKDFIDSCAGGVLMIDEAHQLLDDNLGRMVLQMFLDPMVTRKNDTSFIFCCYPKKEKRLLALDAGFSRRISQVLRFEDYSCEEIIQIMKKKIDKEQYQYSNETDEAMTHAIERIMNEVVGSPMNEESWNQKDDVPRNQNGGFAEKLFHAIKMTIGWRLSEQYAGKHELKEASNSTPDILYTILPEDVKRATKMVIENETGRPDSNLNEEANDLPSAGQISLPPQT